MKHSEAVSHKASTAQFLNEIYYYYYHHHYYYQDYDYDYDYLLLLLRLLSSEKWNDSVEYGGGAELETLERSSIE